MSNMLSLHKVSNRHSLMQDNMKSAKITYYRNIHENDGLECIRDQGKKGNLQF